jgi:AbrB family looped-hinge helix DNA binding protein
MVMAKITSRGQVTIPKEIREKLGAKEGKELEFEIIGEKEAVIKITETPSAEKLAGSLNPENIEGDREGWKQVVNKAKHQKWQSELEDS